MKIEINLNEQDTETLVALVNYNNSNLFATDPEFTYKEYAETLLSIALRREYDFINNCESVHNDDYHFPRSRTTN